MDDRTDAEYVAIFRLKLAAAEVELAALDARGYGKGTGVSCIQYQAARKRLAARVDFYRRTVERHERAAAIRAEVRALPAAAIEARVQAMFAR